MRLQRQEGENQDRDREKRKQNYKTTQRGAKARQSRIEIKVFRQFCER